MVRLDVSLGQEDFGKLDWCPDCGPEARLQRQREIYQFKRDRVEAYTQTSADFEEQTFDTFDLRRDEGEKLTALVRRAYYAAWEFAQDPSGFLVLSGPPGTGKSHLAAAIADHLRSIPEVEYPPLALFFTSPDLFDLLRSGYDAGDYDVLLRLCKEVDVLILDDLGTENLKPWASEKMFQIVNARYQRKMPMVVVTNCRLDDLKTSDQWERLVDRFTDVRFSRHIPVIAPSYRQKRP